jgi:hypothetical protein
MPSPCEVCLLPEEDITVNSGLLNTGMKLQRGGVCTLLLIKCSAAAFNESSQVAWQASIDAGDTLIIRDCLLTAPYAEEATTVQIGCENKTVVTNRTSTLTVTDNSDNTALDRNALYTYLKEYPDAFRLAFVTADGVLYTSQRVTANPNRSVAENTEGFSGVVTVFEAKGLLGYSLIRLSWSVADLTIPNCTVNITQQGAGVGTRTYVAVANLSAGATAIASYVWRVNGVVVGAATTAVATLTVVPTDTVTVTVTDNGTPACVAVSPPVTVV